MSKIRCMCCGSVRCTDQPSPSKDEVGAAFCFNCGEVTICKVYATETDTMNWTMIGAIGNIVLCILNILNLWRHW